MNDDPTIADLEMANQELKDELIALQRRFDTLREFLEDQVTDATNVLIEVDDD